MNGILNSRKYLLPEKPYIISIIQTELFTSLTILIIQPSPCTHPSQSDKSDFHDENLLKEKWTCHKS
jgi:hypothetical protein